MNHYFVLFVVFDFFCYEYDRYQLTQESLLNMWNDILLVNLFNE